ncbi:MAG: copper resistance protein CopD [Flavobacteriales bacterium BRH_c54]|nr:MAG: copper resistance protein CopD [Flavobacteriales bacterium BRH_c54]
MYKLVIILHVLAATIWVGGHLFLAVILLPNILKNKDFKALLDFERKFEKIGIPALLVQVVTGFYLAYHLLPDVKSWFLFEGHLATHIGIKIFLLLATIILALNANFRLIPNIEKGNNLKIMAIHIMLVTLFSLLFLIVGMSVRLDVI